MILVGDSFYFQNADIGYTQIKDIVEQGNKFQKVNLNFVMSTPSKYVAALQRENVAWPQHTGDFFNEARVEGMNQGVFSSRPAFKKHIRDASAQYHTLSKEFSRRVIDKDVSKDQAQKYVQASFDLLDQLSVMQSSEVITGVKSNAVAIDHEYKLQLAQNSAS